MTKTVRPRTLVLVFSLVWIFLVICSAYKFNNPMGVFLPPLVLRQFLVAFPESFVPESIRWLLSDIPSWCIFLVTTIGVVGVFVLGIFAWLKNSGMMAWCFSALAFFFAIPTLMVRGTFPAEWNPYFSPLGFFLLVCIGLVILATEVSLRCKRGRMTLPGSAVFIGCCCFLTVLAWLAKDPVVGGAYEYGEGLAAVYIDGKIGYVDELKRIVIKPRFNDGLEFSEGLAAVAIDCNSHQWCRGYINRNGTFAIQPQRFDEAASFSEGLARVRVKRKFGYIDKSGSIRIRPQFDDALAFSERLAAVKVDGLWGYIGDSGRLVQERVFVDANSFTEGLAAVAIEENARNEQLSGSRKYGFIDRAGTLIIRPEFEQAEPFQGGLATVKVKGKYGCIDKLGAFVIEPRFDAVDQFSDGLAAVSIGGKWGYISKKGRMEVPLKFDFAAKFSQGKAFVRLPGGESGYIDRQGGFSPLRRTFYDQMADFRIAIRIRDFPPGVAE